MRRILGFLIATLVLPSCVVRDDVPIRYLSVDLLRLALSDRMLESSLQTEGSSAADPFIAYVTPSSVPIPPADELVVIAGLSFRFKHQGTVEPLWEMRRLSLDLLSGNAGEFEFSVNYPVKSLLFTGTARYVSGKASLTDYISWYVYFAPFRRQ
jgi:hypothetical protein